MSRTPAQKRRRDFHTKEHWAQWACAVLVANHGEIEVNEYRCAWNSGVGDLHTGLDRARKLGWAKRHNNTPIDRRHWTVTDEGREAAKVHVRRMGELTKARKGAAQ